MHAGRGGPPHWVAQMVKGPRGDGEHEAPGRGSWGRGGPWQHRGHGPGFGGPGRPPWAAFLEHAKAGPGGGPGFGPFGGRPTKVRRGDVRLGILAVLADGPRNGYQLIGEIAERSAGLWKPSPGSVYPTLQQLEDEGLVQADRPEGRRTFALTDDGRTQVEEQAGTIDEMWSSFGEADDDGSGDMRQTIGQLMGAAAQVAFAGTPQQREDAKQVLVDARKRLYQILADGDGSEHDDGQNHDSGRTSDPGGDR